MTSMAKDQFAIQGVLVRVSAIIDGSGNTPHTTPAKNEMYVRLSEILNKHVKKTKIAKTTSRQVLTNFSPSLSLEVISIGLH